MTIKLVTIDIDGTLLNSRREILPAVKEAIARANNADVKIVLCTGRPFTGVKNFLAELDITGPENYVVTYNGSVVENTESKTISQRRLTYDNYLEIEAMSRKIFTPVHIHLNDPAHLVCVNRNINKYSVYESFLVDIPLMYRSPEEITPQDQIIKMMYINEEEKLGTALAQLPKDFYEKYTCVRSERFFFEILNKKASKGQALLDLCAHLNIDVKETMAIGDNENDLSMIETAGIGVAMGNAVELVKNAADFVTKTHDEAGVAFALEKFVL
ncbi:sugar-phosphatase [Enterococcus timonensis]|uniref:sugar-phosphatase n=1 Tax=Enterococcus timonensis TaxID=1852364 RepID=UPI0008D90970|nr:sugar-phosphatase [Enterococcus timonensis]